MTSMLLDTPSCGVNPFGDSEAVTFTPTYRSPISLGPLPLSFPGPLVAAHEVISRMMRFEKWEPTGEAKRSEYWLHCEAWIEESARRFVRAGSHRSVPGLHLLTSRRIVALAAGGFEAIERESASSLPADTRYRGPFPFEYEIRDILDRDEMVERRTYGDGITGSASQWPAPWLLRKSMNGRRLLALWRAKQYWSELGLDPQADVDGFAPVSDADRDQELTARVEDEAFRYNQQRFEITEDDLARWQAEETFLNFRIAEARRELLRLMRERGVDPRNPVVVRWVEKRLLKKSHNRLRAYRSCIYIIRRGFFTGFQYEGWIR